MNLYAVSMRDYSISFIEFYEAEDAADALDQAINDHPTSRHDAVALVPTTSVGGKMPNPNRRYSWSGWHTGADVSPPEPDKEWLSIEEDGEEFAVIVLRLGASTLAGRPDLETKARVARIGRAEQIVDALNAREASVAKKPKKVTWVKDASIQYRASTPGGAHSIEEPHEYDAILHVFVEWDDGTTSEWDASFTGEKSPPEWAREALEWATGEP